MAFTENETLQKESVNLRQIKRNDLIWRTEGEKEKKNSETYGTKANNLVFVKLESQKRGENVSERNILRNNGRKFPNLGKNINL